MIWYTLFFLVFIIVDALIATEMESIAQSKGCESSRTYFWFSLLLGLPGWIMVAALPNRNIERQLEQLSKMQASSQNQTGNTRTDQHPNESNTVPLRSLSADDVPDASMQLTSFLAQAAKCTRIAEILELWNTYPEDHSDTAVAIGKKISDAALIERMYGSNPDKIQHLLNEINEISQSHL